MPHSVKNLHSIRTDTADGKRFVCRIDRILNRHFRIVRIDIRHAHHNLAAYVIPADHKGVFRIGNVDFKRRFIKHVTPVFFPVMETEPVCHAASKHFVSEIHILCLLAFRQHHAVQFGNLSGDVLAYSATADILDRFSCELCRLKCHNLIGDINHNLVIHFIVVCLCADKDRLNATNIVLKELNLPAVRFVYSECLVQHRNYVGRRNFFFACQNLPASVKSFREHIFYKIPFQDSGVCNRSAHKALLLPKI